MFAVEGVALFDGRETSGLHSTKLLNQQSHASAPHRQTWNQLVLSSSYSPLLTLPKLSLCPCQVCLSVQNTSWHCWIYQENLTLLKYQKNLTLLNMPGKSDREVSADVADCGSNHILCTSQVFVKEQPRNEIFSGWRRLLLWQRQHLLRWIWAELLSNRKRRIII